MEQLAWYDNDDAHGYETIIINVKVFYFHLKFIIGFLIIWTKFFYKKKWKNKLTGWFLLIENALR